MATMATSTSLTTSIIDFPGELRNEIYRFFFEAILERSTPVANTGPLPINRDDIQYASANTFTLLSLFLSSRQIGTEALTLFTHNFFPRRHYLLHSRESIYSFSRVPNRWAQNLHQIHLTANGIPQGRKIFNPIKVALVKAARTQITHLNSNSPTTSLQAQHLDLETVNIAWRNTFISRRFTAALTVDGVPTTLRVYKRSNDRFDIILIGPLGKLDWSMIPLTRYTEDSAWEQLLARRERLLLFNGSEIPLHQMPSVGDSELPEPYVEERNAGDRLVTEVAREIVRALGLEVPKKGSWEMSFEDM